MVSGALLQVNHEHDPEEASDESDDTPITQPPVWRRRSFVKGAGVSLVFAAVLGTLCVMFRSSTQSPNSAHHLMHSRGFHNAVEQRVLLTASSNGHALPARKVDREISQDLSEVFTHLEKNFPDLSQKLKNGELPQDQSKALLKMIELQHDKRLKDLGEKAIQVVLANAFFGPKAVHEQLVQKFKPEMPKLIALYKQTVPPSIREAKAKWYSELRKKDAAAAEAAANSPLNGAWEFLTHPKAISIMKTFGTPPNETSAVVAPTRAERRLTSGSGLEQDKPVKLGVGISGFVMNSVNLLVMELSQLLDFKMPWWGWLLTVLPGVSLGTTSCVIAPIEKSYSDFWCLDFLMFTGGQVLEVLVAGAAEFVQDD